MTQMDLFQTATFSPQDTPASHSVLLGSAEAQKMTDTSGRTFFPLFKPNDPLGAFSRMFMATSLWASTKCYLHWQGKSSPQGHSLYQLAVSMPRTDATASGSSPEMWATPSAADSQGTTGGNQHKSLRTDVRMWPTPTTRDHKGGYQGGRVRNGKVSWDTLDVAVQHTDNQTKTGGSLNPQWVEWLMGYPPEWTACED